LDLAIDIYAAFDVEKGGGGGGDREDDAAGGPGVGG